MNKILLIDDDEKLAILISEFLGKQGLDVISEVLPSKGIERLREEKPSLVILDVMLPEMNGFEVCKIIRKESNVPIIMLTARGDINDRVIGLETGADDYLAKPFDPNELVARINTILGRVKSNNAPKKKNIIELDRLIIDKDTHEVIIDENLINLTTKEYTLLLLFIENSKTIFTRDDIMNELSGIDSELFSRSVDILVSRLRNKLSPLKVIETVWGSGYKLAIN